MNWLMEVFVYVLDVRQVVFSNALDISGMVICIKAS